MGGEVEGFSIPAQRDAVLTCSGRQDSEERAQAAGIPPGTGRCRASLSYLLGGRSTWRKDLNAYPTCEAAREFT